MEMKSVKYFAFQESIRSSGAIKVQFLVELANRDVSGFVGKIFSVGAYFYNRVFTE